MGLFDELRAENAQAKADALTEHRRKLANARQARRRSRLKAAASPAAGAEAAEKKVTRTRDTDEPSHAGVTRDESRGHAVTGEVTQEVTSISPGARRLIRVAQAVTTGTPMRTALREQGFPDRSEGVKETVRDMLVEKLIEGAVTVDRIVESTSEALRANSPWLTAEGCIDRADWSARAAGRRDAIALLDRAGCLPQAQAEAPGGTRVTINYRPVVLQAATRTPDVVVDALDASTIELDPMDSITYERPSLT